MIWKLVCFNIILSRIKSWFDLKKRGEGLPNNYNLNIRKRNTGLTRRTWDFKESSNSLFSDMCINSKQNVFWELFSGSKLYRELLNLFCSNLTYLRLCNPVDCSPPGSSVCGIFQARILGRWPFPPPGDLPDPGIEPMSPALQADSFPLELSGKSNNMSSSLQSGRWVASSALR